MLTASFASIVLVRFDEIRVGGTAGDNGGEGDGVLFRRVAADIRAAETDMESETAFKFAIYGLHDSVQSAQRAIDDRLNSMPWITEAKETWCAVLSPFRHYGEANFLDPHCPGPVFETIQPEPAAGSPIVVVTSAGWNLGPDLDMSLVRDFGANVAAVRISMTGVAGLHSQQTFSFPGGLVTDGITVTFWKDFASMREFAYGAGLHRRQVKRQRDNEFGGRTSFTRFAVLHSEGSWHGSDPMIWS
jgi:hypothetical protein